MNGVSQIKHRKFNGAFHDGLTKDIAAFRVTAMDIQVPYANCI
tara:strand:- start:39533 stop:39661 length:129 start_codon:yes stop_codon:yes gene_type:complete